MCTWALIGANYLGPVHLSLWLMDFVQIFREVPEYVQWFTLGVSNFYVNRKQNKNHLYLHTATLDYYSNYYSQVASLDKPCLLGRGAPNKACQDRL